MVNDRGDGQWNRDIPGHVRPYRDAPGTFTQACAAWGPGRDGMAEIPAFGGCYLSPTDLVIPNAAKPAKPKTSALIASNSSFQLSKTSSV